MKSAPCTTSGLPPARQWSRHEGMVIHQQSAGKGRTTSRSRIYLGHVHGYRYACCTVFCAGSTRLHTDTLSQSEDPFKCSICMDSKHACPLLHPRSAAHMHAIMRDVSWETVAPTVTEDGRPTKWGSMALASFWQVPTHIVSVTGTHLPGFRISPHMVHAG